MRRLPILSAIVVLVIGVLTFAQAAPIATAQDPQELHPVVGAWRTTVTNQGADPFASLTTFHADGTYIEVLPDGLVLTGLWQPTGERTAAVTGYLNYFLGEQLVEGSVQFTAEVDEIGTKLTEEGNFIGHYQDGSVAIAIHSPAVGTRLEVRPVSPLGTPVMPSDMPEETTPAS